MLSSLCIAWGVRQEEGLRAALMLEQAALCLLRASPPALRKFAFHMVLAGLRYASSGQAALGARAYQCAPPYPTLPYPTLCPPCVCHEKQNQSTYPITQAISVFGLPGKHILTTF